MSDIALAIAALTDRVIAFRVAMLDRQKLKTEFVGGLQERVDGAYKYVTLNGKTVQVGRMASDQEIEDALAKVDAAAVSNPTALFTPVSSATSEPLKRNVMGTSAMGQQLKKLIADAKADVEKAQTAIVQSVTGIQETVKKAHGLAASIKREDDDLKATLGQFSNDI